MDFSLDVRMLVEGKLEEDGDEGGLLQSCRAAQQNLRKSLLRTTPKFCPTDRRTAPSPGEIPADWVKEPEFLNPDESIGFDERTGAVIYLDDVMRQAEKCARCVHSNNARNLMKRRSVRRELPGEYSYAIKCELIKTVIRLWEEPMANYLKSVFGVLTENVNKVVTKHFGQFAYGGMLSRVL